MSNRFCAPPQATRKPVITSSKIRSAPWRSQRARSPARKPATGGTRLMLPAMGSTMTAAISPAFSANRRSTASRSLYGASRVSAVTAAGTPGEEGTPIVAAPEPAATRNGSACPW
jgi:hypothetical protein